MVWGWMIHYVIPDLEDSYATLFWWPWSPDAPAPTEDYIGQPAGYHSHAERYPYLTWAEANFFNSAPPMHFTGKSYPLTWEAYASQANYEGMRLMGETFVEQKIVLPTLGMRRKCFYI